MVQKYFGENISSLIQLDSIGELAKTGESTSKMASFIGMASLVAIQTRLSFADFYFALCGLFPNIS